MNTDPPAPGEPLIELKDVTFGSVRDATMVTAENVTWTVQAGDFWIVAGLHGAGKSDLLMLIAGLMAPKKGKYLFAGQEMSLSGEARRVKHRLRIGMVFETGQLFGQLTLRENVALPLLYHSEESRETVHQRIEAVLDALELTPYADMPAGALGRNWQKRGGLARALVLSPEVLLLDNPLAGIDLRQRHWWLETISALSKGHPLLNSKPSTLIVTTADLRPWRELGQKFAILRERSLLLLGTWQQVNAARGNLLDELLESPV